MKKAFSLIEIVFALVILVLVVEFFYLAYENHLKNEAYNALYQRLFDEERTLRNASSAEIQIFVENLGTLPFLEFFNPQSFFGLKSLKAPR